MKQHICNVTPFLHDGHLLVSLDRKWIEVFGKIPTFSVGIDKEGKLNLCTIEKITNGDKKQ